MPYDGWPPAACDRCDSPFFWFKRMKPKPTPKPMSYGPTIIVICLHCEASFRIRRGDLMEKCPTCKGHGSWRVALPGEITKSDRRFLKSLRIAPDITPAR